MVINKRIPRDFRDNLLRNVAMILIIALSMALVVSLCSSSDCIVKTISDEWAECNVEDGCFETLVPLSKRNFDDLSDIDVSIEKMFYTDVSANGTSTLRIFTNRNSIDLLYPESGHIPVKNDELFLEKRYAKLHSLSVGDEINVKDTSFTICGIGCFPDYSYVKQNSSDVSASDEFSVAAVTGVAWNYLQQGGKVIYNYAFRLEKNTDMYDLKDKLQHLDFDPSAVRDTYIINQLNSADELKRDYAAISRFVSSPALDNFIEQASEVKLVNISSFSERQYNIRINDAITDSTLGKQSALVVGIFLVILLAYMLATFASGTIEKERPIIGTLYALGCTRGEILRHYMLSPIIIAGLGAVLGMVSGFMLTDTMSAASAGLYSFPAIRHIFPSYLIFYALGLPLIFSVFINYFVLRKKLDAPPLKMMRKTPQNVSGFNINLDKFGFRTKYRLRQFFRGLSGSITLFFGIMISLLLIMFSIACYGSISHYINSITDDIHYNYMYILRNPVSDLPKNSVIGYTRGFYSYFAMTHDEMEVTLVGIDYDNPYFDFAPYLTDRSDKVYMSDSARIKFGYKIGDNVIFRDNAEDKSYSFTIAGEVKYGNGLYFFMNIDAMRKAFGQEYFDPEDLEKGERRPKSKNFYYNTVFSDNKINFKHNMALSEISKADIKSGAEKFMVLMSDMIVMMILVSMLIFVSVMYLLMKHEIDRSSFSVSLLKALGYDEKTVNSFYLGSTFYITLAAVLIGIPVCKLIVDAAYPFCVSNVNAGFKAVMKPSYYGIIVLIIMITYFITRYLLACYLRKINMTEILKNRES